MKKGERKVKHALQIAKLLRKARIWEHPVLRNIPGIWGYVTGRPGDPPMGIQADITRACTFRCDYCLEHATKPVHSVIAPGYGPNKPAMMDYATFTKLVMDNPRAIIVQLQGQGEPTMHPRFTDMIRYARESGKIVYSITNGQGRDQKRYRQTLDDSLDARLDALLFSVDIGEPEAVEKRRRNMKYGDVMKNIEYCVQRKEKTDANTVIGISATITPSNVGDLESSMQRFKQVGAQFVLISPLVTTKNYTDAGIYNTSDGFSLSELEALEGTVEKTSHAHNLLALISYNLCASGNSCTLMRHMYAVPTADGYARKVCQNWHTGGPSFSTAADYSAKMRVLDQRVQAFAKGKDVALMECEGCIVPAILRYKERRNHG